MDVRAGNRQAPIHHAVHAGGELCRAWAGRKVQGRWEFVVQGAGAREPTHISAQTEKERLSWLRVRPAARRLLYKTHAHLHNGRPARAYR